MTSLYFTQHTMKRKVHLRFLEKVSKPHGIKPWSAPGLELPRLWVRGGQPPPLSAAGVLCKEFPRHTAAADLLGVGPAPGSVWAPERSLHTETPNSHPVREAPTQCRFPEP